MEETDKKGVFKDQRKFDVEVPAGPSEDAKGGTGQTAAAQSQL